jgi:hypothetical protein
MVKRQISYVLIVLLIILAGFLWKETERLKEEKQELIEAAYDLETRILDMKKQGSLFDKDEALASITYINYDHKKRFIPKESIILAYPQNGITPINTIEPNTVVDVLDAGYSETEDRKIWLYVAIPTYDSPMNNKGWILEEKTVALTNENQRLVKGDVYLKEGTKVFEVDNYKNISNENSRILSSDIRGRIENTQEGYFYMATPGGYSFWVEEKYIIYPSID